MLDFYWLQLYSQCSKETFYVVGYTLSEENILMIQIWRRDFWKLMFKRNMLGILPFTLAIDLFMQSNWMIKCINENVLVNLLFALASK